jgi:hypothetical protein
MNRRIRLLPSVLGTLATIAGGLAPVPARAQQTASTPAFMIIDVPFPGAHDTIADKINQNGVIVGNYLDAAGGQHGFVAVPPYGAGDFGLIDADATQFPGSHDAAAEGINDLGQIVGSFVDDTGLTVGFFLDTNGVNFRKLDFGFGLVDASGINNHGDIAGTVFHLGAFHGFVLPPNAMSPILIDVPGQSHTEVLAIDDRNEVVGFYEDVAGGQHGFVASPPYGAGDFTAIDAGVAFSGAHDTVVYDINFHAQMVGRYRDAGGSHGFLASSTFIARDFSQIDARIAGGHDTVAIGINYNGQIVGKYTNATGNHGFLHCVDTDGDGLCDDWEKNGLFVNVNGNSVFLDLPGMGADPNHKDVFVQLDTILGGVVTQAALDVVIAAFSNAPVANPDGTIGINLHVDNGPNSIMNPVTGALWGDRSNAVSIIDVDNLGNFDAQGSFDWTIFDREKKLAFLAEDRAPVFHYAISEPVQILGADGKPAAGGIARDIPSSDFILAFGDQSKYDPNILARYLGGAFMHELGHNLGLHHVGGDDINRKPNYLSIMNYEFVYSGLQPTNVYDYSRFGPDSDPEHLMPVLDEAHLDELTGLGTPSQPVGALALQYQSMRYCPKDQTTKVVIQNLNSPIDWDCDQDVNETDVAVPAINGDTSGVCSVIPLFCPLIQLAPYDDWAHLIFTGGHIGSPANAPLPPTTQNAEPTPAQLQDFADFWAAQKQHNIPPTTTAIVSPQPNAAGWNNTNVTVTLNSTDNETGGTGVKQITYSATGAQSIASTVVNGASASFTISAEGVTTISYFGTDNAGNVESRKTLTIQLDKTLPTITPVRTPPPNANGWNNTNVTVSFQCSDTLSGLAAGSPPAPTTLTSEGAGQSVTGTCTDVAGNSASATVSGINIDKTPPTITGSRSPQPNTHGWNNTNVTVSFACSDALSGLAAGSPPAPTVVSTEGAGQSVSGMCQDLAGNSATATVSGINIDKTSPVVTIAPNPSTLWPPDGKMVPVTVSGTMTDNLSGINPSSASFRVVDGYGAVQPSGSVAVSASGSYSFPISLEARRAGTDKNGRTYTITVTTQDNAGNQSSASTTVVVPHDRGN